jgi:hypothetical protein
MCQRVKYCELLAYRLEEGFNKFCKKYENGRRKSEKFSKSRLKYTFYIIFLPLSLSLSLSKACKVFILQGTGSKSQKVEMERAGQRGELIYVSEARSKSPGVATPEEDVGKKGLGRLD